MEIKRECCESHRTVSTVNLLIESTPTHTFKQNIFSRVKQHGLLQNLKRNVKRIINDQPE